MDNDRSVSISKDKAVIYDEGKIIVWNVNTGVGIVFTGEEIANLEKAASVML